LANKDLNLLIKIFILIDFGQEVSRVRRDRNDHARKRTNQSLNRKDQTKRTDKPYR